MEILELQNTVVKIKAHLISSTRDNKEPENLKMDPSK